MNINDCQEKLSKTLVWLNDNYPEMSLTMYDIGARYGVHYLYTELLNLPNFKVIGFEPDKEETVKLNENNLSGRITTFPIALAESKGNRTVYITKHPGCSSLYSPNKEFLANYDVSDLFEVVNQVSVETTSIDDFTSELDVEKPDFIKLDIQGAEHEVLKGGQRNLESNVLGIFLETHLQEMYIGSPLFSDIHALLTNYGFKFISCEYNPNYGGEIIEFDVAYVKDIKYFQQEEDILKSIVFSLIHNNIDFAANIVRKSFLIQKKKIELLEILNKPLDSPIMKVNPEDIYINTNMELRKIKEDWWQQ